MPAEIRAVGPADTALFARIADDVFDGRVTPDRLAAYLAAPNHIMVLALAEGEVVGQIAGVVHRHPDQADELYLDNLGVAPAHRRHGIATRLIDALVKIARQRNCKLVWVGTELDNHAAKALYGRRASTQTIAYYEWRL